ncbi:MAG: S9 family peptidase [Ignavibacteria bacterium]|nr:S9 family peptidase [Ignavibacteria bacterium]
MKKLFLLIFATFLIYGCSKESEKISQEDNINRKPHNLSTIDLYSMKRLSEMQLSPDGKWIVYTVATPSIPDNKLFRDIWATSIDGNENLQITSDQGNEMSPVFSPDGKKIAYLSNKSGSYQVYIQDFPKGTPKQLTSLPEGVSNILWSPDGKYISFTSEVKMLQTIKDEYPDYPKANVLHYTDLPVRHWDEWVDDKLSHLFVVPVDGSIEPVDLMNNDTVDTPLKPFGGSEELGWSPDGKIIAYTARINNDFVRNTNSDIFLVKLDIKDKSVNFSRENITEHLPGYDKHPSFSPDGNWIAFLSQERNGFESDRVRLMLYNRQDKSIFELTNGFDQWIEEFVWSPDSKKIYATATDSGVVSLFEFDIQAKSNKRIARGNWDYGHGLAVTPDGKYLVVGKTNFNNPLDFYRLDLSSGEELKLTKFNDERLKYINPAKFEERWFTALDGKKIHAWIIYPPDFDPTKQYPVITYCQGGPQSMISQNYHYRWNFGIYAANGYIVLAANRRGVPGFGQAWNDAISKDWGGMPMNDLLAATDQFGKEPFVLSKGKAAIGASAGGYAAYWLAGNHKGRFSAFVAHNGVFDVISKYGSTEELFFPNWEFGGPYWIKQHRDNMEKNSPHNYVQYWDTPILISIGMNDFRVPYTQGLEAFTAARSRDIPAELIVFPNETHFISGLQEYIIWQDKVIKFLDKYTKNKN